MESEDGIMFARPTSIHYTLLELHRQGMKKSFDNIRVYDENDIQLCTTKLQVSRRTLLAKRPEATMLPKGSQTARPRSTHIIFFKASAFPIHPYPKPIRTTAEAQTPAQPAAPTPSTPSIVTQTCSQVLKKLNTARAAVRLISVRTRDE